MSSEDKRADQPAQEKMAAHLEYQQPPINLLQQQDESKEQEDVQKIDIDELLQVSQENLERAITKFCAVSSLAKAREQSFLQQSQTNNSGKKQDLQHKLTPIGGGFVIGRGRGLQRFNSHNYRSDSGQHSKKTDIKEPEKAQASAAKRNQMDQQRRQAANLQLQHLENHFKRKITDVNDYFGNLIWTWTNERLANASTEEKREFMARHAEEQFKGDFFEIARAFLVGSRKDKALAFSETDAISIVDLTFKMIEKAGEDAEKLSLLYELLIRFLDGERIPQCTDLDNLSVQITPNLQKFMLNYWDYWMQRKKKFPKYQTCHLASKWGVGCECARKSYAGMPDGWGNLKNIQNQKYEQPSSKHAHSHVADLFWAISDKYDRIARQYLKSLFFRTNMLLHEAVCEKLNATPISQQESSTLFATKCVIENSNQIDNMIRLIDILTQSSLAENVLLDMIDHEGKDILEFANFIELAEGISNMTDIQAYDFVKKNDYSLKKCHRNLKLEIARRENQEINQEAVQKELNLQREQFSTEQNKAYENAMNASNFLTNMQSNGVYQMQNFQMHMIATICAQFKKKYVLSVHPPGTGKSWIAALLVAYYHLKNKSFKFLILSSDNILVTQIHKQLSPYLRDLKITFGTTDLLNTSLSNYLVIIDEADRWMEKFGVSFDIRGNLHGLYSLKSAIKVHMLTATATTFLKDMHKMICNGEIKDCFFEFEAKNQIGQQDRLNIQRNAISFPNAQEKVLEAFRQKIKEEQSKNPVIIFTEDDQKLWEEELTNLYAKEDLEVVSIKDDESALKYRTRDETKTRGIYILSQQYARGYDLKLGADAVVLVLAYKKGFKWSVVNQMFGRGCRSFGVSRGYYFTWLFPKTFILENQLRLNEKEFYDAHKIVARLFDTYHNIHIKQRDTIAKAFAGENWICTESQFKTRYPDAFSIIYAKEIEEQKKEMQISLTQLSD